ncbi:hypothetical protein AIOL_003558 [Candidatus Rhodobacter oscarellae]|uniref:Uncharacterized protein n=1 Tax=Candidatus Rhodobacter oscarellae TaxID=1675527 RepID=A0A0J9E734_9RHOB|nr:hypothetical protein AIOL_003558 [Candidatus Rhodobacter lobularis]
MDLPGGRAGRERVQRDQGGSCGGAGKESPTRDQVIILCGHSKHSYRYWNLNRGRA